MANLTLTAVQAALIRSALAQGALELRLHLRNDIDEGWEGLAHHHSREIVRNERAQYYVWGLDWPCDDANDATIDDVEKGSC